MISMRNANKYCILLLACVASIISAADYTPHFDILLNCGSDGESTDVESRTWASDGVHIHGWEYIFDGPTSFTSRAATQKPSVQEVPYMTARISKSPFTYSFEIPPGRKFIRLHFYPVHYSDLNPVNGVFSVSVGGYTLLKNFSPLEYVNALNKDLMMKEYSVSLNSGPLSITFTPDPNTPNSYAFLNGIEVVDHPDIYSNDNLILVGATTTYPIDNSTALECVYRMNVGGSAILPSKDSGLFRFWEDDIIYIYSAAIGVALPSKRDVKISYPWGTPTYVAPENVYTTARMMGPTPIINENYNLTWSFDVDTSFYYLMRLHFCEIFQNISRPNERVFRIFIEDQTAEAEADVVAWAGSNYVVVHKDYVFYVPNKGGVPRWDLSLKLTPNTETKASYSDAILNGVEIFKLSNYDKSLAGSYPVPVPRPDHSQG